MTRRFFIGTAALSAFAGLGSAAEAVATAGGNAATKKPVPPRNRQPYSGLDWEAVKEVHTTSHGHCDSQKMLDAYVERGFELLTISNYYPSAPTMPLKTFRDHHYHVHHDFPVVVNGKLTDGPFDWSKIVGDWADELSAEQRAQLPFTEGPLRFSKVPDGILEAPNAEHHAFLDENGQFVSGLHMCAPGSAYCSGTFDKRNRFLSNKHGYQIGNGLYMLDAVDRMIAGLVHPDGGGVTINHPAWSHLEDRIAWKLLDHDPRVLGLEVFNMCKTNARYPWARRFCEDYWDRALSTGRQCFGFFVPDWGLWEGVNVLLVPEKSVHACLRAYRQGHFYGAIKGRGILRFTSIRFSGAALSVTLDKPAHIQVISRLGVTKWVNRSKSLTFSVPKADRERLGYLRVRAYALDGSGEIIFSQPTMLT